MALVAMFKIEHCHPPQRAKAVEISLPSSAGNNIVG
jgi:hypothetical protein